MLPITIIHSSGISPCIPVLYIGIGLAAWGGQVQFRKGGLGAAGGANQPKCVMCIGDLDCL